MHFSLFVTGSVANIKTLLDAGADVNTIIDTNLNTLLHSAVLVGNFNLVEVVVLKTPNFKLRNKKYETPLEISLAKGREEISYRLLDMLPTDYDTSNLLHASIKGGSFSLFKRVLMTNRQHLNKLNTSGNAPLHIAAIYGRLEMAEILMKYDCCNIEILNNNNNASPIGLSVASKDTKMVRLILNAIPTINLGVGLPDYATYNLVASYKEKTKGSLFWYAVDSNSLQLVRIFLHAGVKVWKEKWIHDDKLVGSMNIDKNIQALLHEALYFPQNLQTICRTVVRTAIGGQLDKQVAVLPLTHTMKAFLLQI